MFTAIGLNEESTTLREALEMAFADPYPLNLFEGRDEIASPREAELHHIHAEARRIADLETIDRSWSREARRAA